MVKQMDTGHAPNIGTLSAMEGCQEELEDRRHSNDEI